eukprot:1147012-Pelagomonas_calceolata.AAC.2
MRSSVTGGGMSTDCAKGALPAGTSAKHTGCLELWKICGWRAKQWGLGFLPCLAVAAPHVVES